MRDPALLVEKRALRKEVRRRMEALSPDLHTQAGQTIADRLRAVVDAVAAGPIALFASLPHELDTGPLDRLLLSRGRPRLLPAIVDGELSFRLLPMTQTIATLARDAIGIPTPGAACATVALADAALVFVPGAAFDDDGARLGWGKGYYDRALSTLPLSVPTIALLHDAQRVQRVPHDDHDVPIAVTCSPSQTRVHRPLPAPVESAIHAAFARRGNER
jgi:5-formyltetrahydrofolate cyclo-ligase